MKIYQMPRNSGKTTYLYHMAKSLEEKIGEQVSIIGTDSRRQIKEIDKEENAEIYGVNILEILNGEVDPPSEKIKVMIDDMDMVITQIFNHFNLEPICGVYTDEGEEDVTTKIMLS